MPAKRVFRSMTDTDRWRMNPLKVEKRRVDRMARQYHNQIVVVSDGDVLGSGDHLDEILGGIDLGSAGPKIIAYTVKSLSEGRFVWIKNESYCSDVVMRHEYCAAAATDPMALGRVNQQGAHQAAIDAKRLDSELSKNVYKRGSGYTVANFF